MAQLVASEDETGRAAARRRRWTSFVTNELSAAAGPQPPTDADPEDSGHEPTFFERHYTKKTRQELTAMYLTGHQSLVTAADAAGFRNVEVIPLKMVQGWETSPGSDLPYSLSATR